MSSLKKKFTFGILGNPDQNKKSLINNLTEITNSNVYELSNLIKNKYFEYETKDRIYHYLDYPDQDFLKLNILGYVAADLIIITISSSDYEIDKIKRYVELTRKLSIENIIILVYDDDNFYVQDYVKSLFGDQINVLRFQNDNNSIYELLDLIESLPHPISSIDQPFLLPIEDVFNIKSVGIIVIGLIERGSIFLDSDVEVVGNNKIIKTNIRGIELFRKFINYAKTGDSVGLLLSNVSEKDIERGMVVSKPGIIKSYKNCEAYIYLLTKEEGGLKNSITNGFKTNFYFRTIEIHGKINFKDNIELAIPGDSVRVEINLIQSVPMEKGDRFAVRENGRTIGSGIVSDLF